MFGEAEFIDEHSIRLNGSTISVENWVIATGSSPAVPPIPGMDKTPYWTNRDLYSLDRLPGSMIVLGAVAIGLEMAQAFCRLGSRIMVVELADQVLINEDREMAKAVVKVLAEEGVEFHLNARAVGLKDAGPQREVTIQKSGGNTVQLGAEATPADQQHSVLR